MKVLYDHQIFTEHRYGGVSRYFCELLRSFAVDRQVTSELALVYSDNEHLKALRTVGGGRFSFASGFLGGRDFRGKARLFGWLNQANSLKRLRQGDYDLFHPTYYDDYFLSALGNKPFVLTVHDLIHELYPEYFAPHHPLAARKRRLIEQARRIIAISEQTKKDLVRVLNVAPDKVTVVHLASSLGGGRVAVGPAISRRVPPKYLLYVGNRQAYKNYELLVRAIRPLLLADPDLLLVCAGPAFTQQEERLLVELGLHGRVRGFYIDSDVTLAYLYQNALAFVFPSLYEGFGLPVLEAFSCGCPVVLSNASSLPEVAGEAAEYFEPKSGADLLKAVTAVIGDQAKRAALVAKGYERLKKFSWDKTAAQTKEVYREALA
ncbi:MAG: glycosyltransferase family 1 protein [Candidatus Margulisiibacteriota bacterium]